MATEYNLNESLQDALDAMLADVTLAEFKPLRDHKIKILACTKVKMTEEEEQPCSGEPAQVKKVSDMHRLFIDAHYLVVVDQYTYNHLDDVQVSALIHSALMRIGVEETESGVKLGTRKPDIMVFQATINRFGAYTADLKGLRDCLVAASERFVDMVTTGTEAPAEPPEEPPHIQTATEELGEAQQPAPLPRRRMRKGE